MNLLLKKKRLGLQIHFSAQKPAQHSLGNPKSQSQLPLNRHTKPSAHLERAGLRKGPGISTIVHSNKISLGLWITFYGYVEQS